MARCRRNAALVAATTIVLGLMMMTSYAKIHVTHHTRVFITNRLDVGIPARSLTLHCKSKDDDLGFHTLAPGETWNFDFYPRPVAGTLFYCSFTWPGVSETKYFNAYQESRDMGHCNHCCWTVIPDGMCRCACEGTCNFLGNCYGWNKS